MKTKKQILAELKQKNVDLGKNPSRNFYYWSQEGLLPKYSNLLIDRRKELYPDWVPEWIQKIRELQEEGLTLREIKHLLTDKILLIMMECLSFEELVKYPLYSHIECNGYYFPCFRNSNREVFKNSQSKENEIIFMMLNDLNPIAKTVNVIDTQRLSVIDYGDMIKEIAIRKMTGDWDVSGLRYIKYGYIDVDERFLMLKEIDIFFYLFPEMSRIDIKMNR